MEKRDFFLPQVSSSRRDKPENLLFSARLQEFAQRVGYITNLETGGKIPPQVAFNQIEELWNQIERP